MFATAIFASAIQSYVLVGLISVLILPRTRAAIMQPLRERSWSDRPRAGLYGFGISIIAIAAVAWPWLLRSAYLDRPQQAVR